MKPRHISAILAALLLAGVVTFAGQGQATRDAAPVGLGNRMGPETRETPVEGESDEWLPPGIVSVDEVLNAKERSDLGAVRAAETPFVSKPVAGPRCPAPCLEGSFSTMTNVSDVSPADPAGAAGDNHVVAAVNISYGIYDRSGTPELGPAKLKRLLPPRSGFVFDPKVIYDQYNDTYLLVFLVAKGSTRSWVTTVAIPDATATDKSTWCKRRIPGDQITDGVVQLADYPGLGYDGKRVYISTNQFGQGWYRYYGTQIMAIPTGGLYDCGQRLQIHAFGGDETHDPDGGKSSSIQPAASDGTTMPDSEYLVSFDYSCGIYTCQGDTIVLWRIRETPGGLKLSKTALDVGKAVIPPFGTQRGAPKAGSRDYWWDTGDLRLTNAFYDVDLDRLYTAHSVDHNFGDFTYDEASARWYEVDPEPTLAASVNTRTGYVGAPGLDLGWPAVATNSDGVLFMTVSGAGYVANQFLSVYATTIPAGTTTPNALIQTHAGSATYDWGRGHERWGDYNQINRDPQDPTRMFAFNQTAIGMINFQHHVDRISDL